MGANPHANGGRILRELEVPDFRKYAAEISRPGTEQLESVRRLGEMTRDIFAMNKAAANFRLFCPDETNSNRMSAVFEVEKRSLVRRRLPIDERVAADGRVMEV